MWRQSLLFYQREGIEHVEEKIIHSIMRINSQDRISDSPYCLPSNSYDMNLENLVLDQIKIPSLIFYFSLVTSMLDIILIL